jgi:hypothetical protein
MVMKDVSQSSTEERSEVSLPDAISTADHPADAPQSSATTPGDGSASPPPEPAQPGENAPTTGGGPGHTVVTPTRVGVLVVHGIGEQRRFEHLEEQIKKIARALLNREKRTEHKTKVTLETMPPAGGAPYQSEQDSWMSGRFPAVRALVQHGDHLEQETHLYFHEVWWADANERLSLAKQIRFWGWGLAMWTIRGKENSEVAGFNSGMKTPSFPNERPTRGKENSKTAGFKSSMALPTFLDGRAIRLGLFNRVQLFLTAWIFLLSSLSVTLAVFALKRLNFGVWSPVNTFVNYVSGAKLYTQSHRTGGGPLEGIKEPPRFTIRRRMVRSLVDVATSDYDRWYVLAHSLGSVVAFNGLMTHAHSIPNYLDERRWRILRRHAGWTGPARSERHETIEKNRPEIPPRPLWIRSDDLVVYREKLFGSFRGLLTYGSPLDKFAGMWPAYVPINQDTQAFRQDAKWFNIFDRADPVAASLKAYQSDRFSPVNYGYSASPWLLLGHLKYLDLHRDPGRKGKEPADCVVDWLLNDRFEPPRNDDGTPKETAGWYQAGSSISKRRVLLAYLQWAIVAAILTYLGVWVLRWLLRFAGISFDVGNGLLAWIVGFLDTEKACATGCAGLVNSFLAEQPTFAHSVGLAICAAAFTIVIGGVGWLVREDDDDPHNW